MSKALLVARLFYSKEISAEDPLPPSSDPKWIRVKTRSPIISGSCTNRLVWAKDENQFIFKAFYFSGCRAIDGFWPASSTLESFKFGPIEYWMPYE